MSHIILTRQVQVVLLDDSGKEKGFLIMFINGKVGTVASMIGKGILKDVANKLPGICEELGVDKVGAVMEPHVLERFKVHAGHLNIAVEREIEYAGKPMLELAITQG